MESNQSSSVCPMAMVSSFESKYKNKGLTSNELRKRREDDSIQLRKQKRDEQFGKRRNMDTDVPASIDTDVNIDSLQEGGMGSDGNSQTACITAETMQLLFSDLVESQLAAAITIRKVLSRGPTLPIDLVAQTGVVQRLTSLLETTQFVPLQFESAWALTNISSGASVHTGEVVNAGAVPVFVQLLQSDSALNVKEQAVWALGNIAGDCPSYRDYCLQLDTMPRLVEILLNFKNNNNNNNGQQLSLLRNVVWTISNLCRGKHPPADFSKTCVCVEALAGLLMSVNDYDILRDGCWAVAFLCDGPNDQIELVLATGIAARLAQLLTSPNDEVCAAALRAVGNIVTGDDNQTQAVLSCSVLDCFVKLLGHSKETIRRETCWTVSNITAGNRGQIEAVIEAKLVPALVAVLARGDFKARKEACWAITNIVRGGSNGQVKHVVDNGAVGPLCDLLTVMDPKVIHVALTGLEHILKCGQKKGKGGKISNKNNAYAVMVEEAYGLDKLDFLLQSKNMEIYAKAYELMDTFFSNDES